MTDFLLFAGALLLASLLFGRSRPGFIWAIAALLVAVAGQAFAQLSWGGQFVARLLGGFLGLFGSAAVGATFLLIFFTGVALFDVIVDKKLDKKGAVALFIIPLLALLAGGPLADGLSSAYGSVRSGVVTAVSSI